MKSILSALLSFFTFCGFGQTEFATADACFDKKDYSCALTNYLSGYTKNLYNANNKYLIEFRIGFCYGNIAQPNQLAKKSWYHKSIATKPDYAYSWWNLAIDHYQHANYDSAVTCYRKANNYLSDKDEKQNIFYWIAWSYRKKGNYQSAINDYKNIYLRTDKYRIIDFSIAESFVNLNKYDSARGYAEKSKEYIKPTDTLYDNLQFKLGQIYSYLGEYGKAEEAFDLSASADPKRIYDVAWEKGIIYSKQNDHVKSAEYYRKALVNYKNDTVNARVLLNNITIQYRKTTDYKGLVNALNEQLQYADYKDGYFKEIATVQLLKLKQPKEAAKTIESSLSLLGKSLDSNNYSIKTWRSNMLAMQGFIFLYTKDSAKAIKSFADAVRYDYSNLVANLRLGDIYWNRGKEDEFKKYYLNANIYSSDTLLNTKADLARAYARKAHVRYFYYSYKPTDIKNDVDNALKFDSLQKEVIYLWPVVLKDHYSLASHREACLFLLDKGIKKYAADKKYLSDLYNAKGVLLNTKKDSTGTHKAFEEGIKLYPDNLSVWDNLLKYFDAQKNYDGGIAACDRLIKQLIKNKNNKSLATTFVYKGDFLWKQNKKENAKKAYAEALVWDADNATAKERAKLQ